MKGKTGTIAKADFVIRSYGNRVRLALALGVTVLSFFLPWMVANHLPLVLLGDTFGAEASLEWGRNLLFLGLWLLLGLMLVPPSISLFYGYAYRLYRGGRDACGFERVGVTGGYGRSWCFGLLISLRPTVGILLLSLALRFSDGGSYVLRLLLLGLAVLLTLLWMWGSCGWFLLPYCLCRGASLGDALRRSRSMMRGQKALYGRFLWTFSGGGLLSVVTVGIWLITHTLPQMTCTYFTLAEKLSGEGIQ